MKLNYDCARFDAATVEWMAEHLTTLLEGIAANPERRISELPLMTDTERRTVVDDWNQTAAAFPESRCLHELFLDQVRRTPDAIAVSFGDEHLAYSELNKRANRVNPSFLKQTA